MCHRWRGNLLSVDVRLRIQRKSAPVTPSLGLRPYAKGLACFRPEGWAARRDCRCKLLSRSELRQGHVFCSFFSGSVWTAPLHIHSNSTPCQSSASSLLHQHAAVLSKEIGVFLVTELQPQLPGVRFLAVQLAMTLHPAVEAPRLRLDDTVSLVTGASGSAHWPCLTLGACTPVAAPPTAKKMSELV